jgi:hypothetical protein
MAKEFAEEKRRIKELNKIIRHEQKQAYKHYDKMNEELCLYHKIQNLINCYGNEREKIKHYIELNK